MTITHLLTTNAVVLAVSMTALWAYCVRIKDVSVIDAFWPFGMVLLAATSFVMLGAEGTQATILFGLTAIWGLRLSVHLFTRWRAHGVDPRYTAILGRLMAKRGWSFAKASFIQVFLMQYALLFIVCLPAQLGAAWGDDTPLSMIQWAGVAIALIGIAFETIGDAQLSLSQQPGHGRQGAGHGAMALYTASQLFWRCLHLVGDLAGGCKHPAGCCDHYRTDPHHFPADAGYGCADAGASP